MWNRGCSRRRMLLSGSCGFALSVASFFGRWRAGAQAVRLRRGWWKEGQAAVEGP